MGEPNNSAQSAERQNSMNAAKQVEFYSQGVAAWFNSALEHDKSLLTLSVAGVGVLVSIMQTAIDSVCTLILFIGALLSFTVCLASVLWIFKRNKKHIVDVFNGQTTDDPVLGILDDCASTSFLVAMLLSVLLGISSATITYTSKGKTMATDNSKTAAQSLPTYDSVNGLAKLNPVTESFNQMANMQKSFQGMAQLQTPVQNQQVTQVTTPAPAASTQNNPASASKK